MLPQPANKFYTDIYVISVTFCNSVRMFDYVKDIGKNAIYKSTPFQSPLPDITAILHHFDVVVAQKAYTPYKVKFGSALSSK